MEGVELIPIALMVISGAVGLFVRYQLQFWRAVEKLLTSRSAH